MSFIVITIASLSMNPKMGKVRSVISLIKAYDITLPLTLARLPFSVNIPCDLLTFQSHLLENPKYNSGFVYVFY